MANHSDKRVVVTYKDSKYDVTDFLHHHPGGLTTLGSREGDDVTKRLMWPVAHSPAALYLLQNYKVPSPQSNKTMETNSEEHLVDWTRPMLVQIPKLGDRYSTWVNLPVDQPLRLFGPDWLEVLTKTPWWAVPTFWIPTILLMLLNAGAHTIKTTDLLYHITFGFCLWTLVEYCLHRWLFHMNVEGKNKYRNTIHFLLHGLHHKVPFDPMRLVFPPFPAVLLALFFYPFIHILLSNPQIKMAGGLAGYVCYDMIHYYLHYGSPNEKGLCSYFYKMKRYHHQHHFVHHDQGFGISSHTWDMVFGTRIYLRKLGFSIKWS